MKQVAISIFSMFAILAANTASAESYFCTSSAQHGTIIAGTLEIDGGGLVEISEEYPEMTVDLDRGILVLRGQIYDMEFTRYSNTLYKIRGERTGGYSGMMVMIGDPPYRGGLARDEKVFVFYNDNTFNSGKCSPRS